MVVFSIRESHVEEDGGQLVQGDRVSPVSARECATGATAGGRGFRRLPWRALCRRKKNEEGVSHLFFSFHYRKGTKKM